ncbi:hypothetical protein B0J15DRAFT_473831 [Fusarium solani]|uniref:Zn(2)-C6 fungal-type domain-containing protein n=1 Tax=Fusarium solani TaxID=169388 RepID=A0A9P9L6N9_FUSSL|nr:uncharacterized protein B0J15DRAFT_473831 [Fusarium solani]KAH7274923.1 hypothetical protein B0J15DRAFT_473831 [Fusarium solani]
MAGNQEKPGQACDSCRFRKVKCDRGQPCKNCHAGDLRCQYLHSIRRKGPKEGQGRRQSQLRRGLVDFGKSSFPVTTRNAAPLQRRGGSSRSPESHPPTPTRVITQHDTLNTASPLIDQLPERAGQSRLLSVSLIAHIHLFLNALFPIMPVIDGVELLADAARLEELAPSRYALILALCAATRMQFRMDNAPVGEEGPEVNVPLEPQLTGDMLIRLAETSLRQYNVIDDSTLDSTLTSFFLFASYGSLNNSRHAWFYLNQSISLAQSLDITRETGYHDLPHIEREKRRRVFWLLFVTERTFALQHRRSVMLRSSITKPGIIDSDCPIVMNDFINHIRLFESLPSSLYEWQSTSDSDPLEHLSLVYTINDSLCTVQADQSVIPSQRFDTVITQQWLRISMWRLAVGKKPLPSVYDFGLLFPPSLPIDAGKIIMSALGSVGPKSKDCHGIGMEQKLFDVGVSLADSAMLPSWSSSSFEIGPRDLLCVVIEALSTARGCQSHLLPTLLGYSESVLGVTDPSPHIDFILEMPQETETAIQTAIVEDVSEEFNEQVNSSTWLSGDELDLLDMSTPLGTWDDIEL